MRKLNKKRMRTNRVFIEWLVFDRSPKSSTTQISLRYYTAERKFEGHVRQRATKYRTWPAWDEAGPKHIEIARALLSPEEIAECTAASITAPPRPPNTNILLHVAPPAADQIAKLHGLQATVKQAIHSSMRLKP